MSLYKRTSKTIQNRSNEAHTQADDTPVRVPIKRPTSLTPKHTPKRKRYELIQNKSQENKSISLQSTCADMNSIDEMFYAQPADLENFKSEKVNTTDYELGHWPSG